MKIFRRSKEGVASGDAIPLFHEGKFHLFFLTSPKGSTVYPRRICTTWRHAVSENLVDWQELQPALLPGGGGTTIDKDGCWTGSALYGEGRFHIFYTAANLDSATPQTIAHATSEDGEYWTKDGDAPVIVPIEEHYELIDWRDPYVFYNADEGCWWMLIAGRKNKGPDTRRACVVLYKSKDLAEWVHHGILYDPGYTNVTECPEMFKMGDYWYLTHSRFSEGAQTVYRYSRSPYGPWRVPRREGVGGRRFYAAKSAANDKGRRFYFGWVHERARPVDTEHWCWGGDFCIPHEIIQRPDGELDFAMPKEIEATFTQTLDWGFEPCGGDIRADGEDVEVDAEGGMAYGFFTLPTDRFLMTCTLRPQSARDVCAVLLKADGELARCYQLALEPGSQRVSLTKFPVPMDPYWADASVAVKDFSVIEPDGPRVCEKAFSFQDGDAIELKIVVDGDIMECFIGGQVAFSFRCYRTPEHEIGLLVQDGKVRFENIRFLA